MSVALSVVAMFASVQLPVQSAPAPLSVTSTAFAHGAKIPKDHVVYAIDDGVTLVLDKPRLLAAIDGHVVGKGELVGFFER